jgi:hypothetical protein
MHGICMNRPICYLCNKNGFENSFETVPLTEEYKHSATADRQRSLTAKKMQASWLLNSEKEKFRETVHLN